MLAFLLSCEEKKDEVTVPVIPFQDTVKAIPEPAPATMKEVSGFNVIPDSIVAFARTLQGIPYLFASTDPAKGFDCSGYITYVFNHFGLKVPRSSVDFTNYGRELTNEEVRPGDLVLFTGTDSTIRVVGHMGIVESINDGVVSFLHSTSGKAYGVVITPMNKYYNGRFVKYTRVLADSLFTY